MGLWCHANSTPFQQMKYQHMRLAGVLQGICVMCLTIRKGSGWAQCSARASAWRAGRSWSWLLADVLTTASTHF